MEKPLGDAAGGGDDDHHHELRLQQQDLDADDRRGLERRRGHEREQSGHLREHLRGGLQRGLDLGPRRVQVERELRRLRCHPAEHLGRVIAIAGLGRHASGGGVRVREQPEPLELGELVADGRRGEAELRLLDQRLRAHRLTGRDVLLHHVAEQVTLAVRKHDPHCRTW